MDFKKRKKSKIFIKPDCGNVEHNQAIFNNMNSATEGPCVNPTGPMGESLNEMLDVATPYMLRNDGKLVSCKPLHPYVKYIYEASTEEELKSLVEDRPYDLLWFYKNTHFETTKKEIITLVSSVLHDENNFNLELLDKLFTDVPKYDTCLDKSDLYQLYEELNSQTNQEFCRIRTSSNRFGGTSHELFVRISSVSYNWYDVLWKLVYDNKNWIDSITITNDPQAMGGPTRYKQINGNDLAFVDIDTFLNYKGNPLVEKFTSCSSIFEELKTKSLSDILHTSSSNFVCKYVKHLIEAENKTFGSVATLNEENNMRNDEKITLDYPKLQFVYQGPMRDVDDWDEYDVTMDWSIDVDKEDIITCLYEDCITDEVVPNWYEMTTEESVKYVEDHFDELFERYQDEILNHFEEDAVENAEKNYDPDDYVDWDSMPGGHDDIREDCSKTEDIDDVDDVFEYVAVLDNPYEHLCKEESCEKVDDEISDNWL